MASVVKGRAGRDTWEKCGGGEARLTEGERGRTLTYKEIDFSVDKIRRKIGNSEAAINC